MSGYALRTYLLRGSSCVAQRKTPHREAKLLRLWVQIPPGAGLFSSLLYPISSASLIQVPHGGATLLIFLHKNMLSRAVWGEANSLHPDWAKKPVSLLSRQFQLHREAPEADAAVLDGLPLGGHRHPGWSQDHQQEQGVLGKLLKVPKRYSRLRNNVHLTFVHIDFALKPHFI